MLEKTWTMQHVVGVSLIPHIQKRKSIVGLKCCQVLTFAEHCWWHLSEWDCGSRPKSAGRTSHEPEE